jgi:hypothetical protein
LDAATRLYNAAKTKNAPVMFLIATKKGGYFPMMANFPPGVKIINAPSLSISEILENLQVSR